MAFNLLENLESKRPFKSKRSPPKNCFEVVKHRVYVKQQFNRYKFILYNNMIFSEDLTLADAENSNLKVGAAPPRK